MMAIVGTLTYEFEVPVPVFAEQLLTASASEYAALTATFGFGSVACVIAAGVGALILRQEWVRHRRRGRSAQE